MNNTIRVTGAKEFVENFTPVNCEMHHDTDTYIRYINARLLDGVNCKHFISYKELYRDDNEPEDRGICTANPEHESEDEARMVSFAICDQSCAENCPNKK